MFLSNILFILVHQFILTMPLFLQYRPNSYTNRSTLIILFSTVLSVFTQDNQTSHGGDTEKSKFYFGGDKSAWQIALRLVFISWRELLICSTALTMAAWFLRTSSVRTGSPLRPRRLGEGAVGGSGAAGGGVTPREEHSPAEKNKTHINKFALENDLPWLQSGLIGTVKNRTCFKI